MILYNAHKFPRLRAKFAGAAAIERNYSQAYQDMFVLTMLDGKKNGTYLEIGAHDGVFISNTYLLESSYGWRGLSLDIDKMSAKSFKKHRRNPLLLADALAVDFAALAQEHGLGPQIDYLSIDIEPKTQTLACLKKILAANLRFSVITYETDYYDDSEGREVAEQVRSESRRVLGAHGYDMIVGNIANTGPDDIFEDWYVDPKAVDPEIIKIFKTGTDFNDASEKFMLLPPL